MFKTGEFSKLARVSIRLLRYYDEIGLLKPAYTNTDTNYRYYTIDQLPRLNRILALKDLGLTLDQIGRYLDNSISPDEIRGMLMMRKAEIEQTLQDELGRLQRVEARLRQMEQETNTTPQPRVEIKAIPDMTILSQRKALPSLEATMGMFQQIRALLPAESSHDPNIGKMVVINHAEGFDENNIDVEFGIITTDDDINQRALDAGLSVRTLVGSAMMAVALFVGEGQHANTTYNALGHWMAEHHYELADLPRELMLKVQFPPMTTEQIIEFQFPVQPISHQGA